MWGPMSESDSCSFISLSYLFQIFKVVLKNDKRLFGLFWKETPVL